MGVRREGRESAIQFLYQNEIHPVGQEELEKALEDFWYLNSRNKKVRAFAESHIRGILGRLPELDEKIRELTKNWDFERIASVDRNILRLGVYEILYCDEIPPVVAINEAIDIAKRFSTEEAGKFINGILDRLKQETLRPSRHATGQ